MVSENKIDIKILENTYIVDFLLIILWNNMQKINYFPKKQAIDD